MSTPETPRRKVRKALDDLRDRGILTGWSERLDGHQVHHWTVTFPNGRSWELRMGEAMLLPDLADAIQPKVAAT